MNVCWRNPALRVFVRELSMLALGHAPDAEYSWADVLSGTVKNVSCGCSWGRIRCSCCYVPLSGTTSQMSNPGVVERGEIKLQDNSDRLAKMVRRAQARGLDATAALRAAIHSAMRDLLLGRTDRKTEKELRDVVPALSKGLSDRHRVTVKITLKWLRGRRDLLGYVDSLVDSVSLGSGCFCTLGAVLATYGDNPVLSLLNERRVFDQCHLCYQSSVKTLKKIARFGAHDAPLSSADLFDWQYVGQLAGRLTGDEFMDFEDMLGRQDYEDLVQTNMASAMRAEFDAAYEREVLREAERFGMIAAASLRTSKRELVYNHENALVRVPTGSVAAVGVTDACAEEVPKAHVNKKIAFMYMTDGERRALRGDVPSSWSELIEKNELGKVRPLAPGSLGLYDSSTTLSAYAESTFLAGLPECPLLWSDTRRDALDRAHQGWCDEAYVANRDFKNYNVCHRHELMAKFYAQVSATLKECGADELAKEADYCASAMESVGIELNGKRHVWKYGLQTGWRHTMLFNITFNVCSGRVCKAMVEKAQVGRLQYGSYQGDDGAEFWTTPFAGPMVQAILDAAGQTGQADKQHFARAKCSWSEFLRVRCTSQTREGSGLRTVCSFVSNDSQHPATEGGFPQVAACVDGLNTLWRRRGGRVRLRESDVSALCAYWATSNEQFRSTGKIVDWRAYFTTGCKFGQLSLTQWPTLDWEGYCVLEMVARHETELGPILLKRARRNLNVVAVAGASDFAREYAQDLMLSASELSSVACSSRVGKKRYPSDCQFTADQTYCAVEVLKAVKAGKRAARDQDALDKEMAVGLCFGGSERVAKAFVAEGRQVFYKASVGVRDRLHNGLRVLAGKTCTPYRRLSKRFECPERYWGHLHAIGHRLGMQSSDAHAVALLINYSEVISGRRC